MARFCLQLAKKWPKQFATLVVKVETPVVSKGKEIVCVSTAVCEERVVSEPSMLQIKGSIHNQSIYMLIDSGSIHNLMSSKFASRLGLPVFKIEACKVFLGQW